MGDRGGSTQPGCKWHLRQQGKGVCAICLRTSLEKLAAYQGEYQESFDTYTGAFLSTSVAELSRERDSSAQSIQPTYPSVSYRTRSKKEFKHRGGITSQDRSTSNFRKPTDSTSSKAKISWGVAVHRIASLRSALSSLWKSDNQPEGKRNQNTEVRDMHDGKPHGLNGAKEERKEKFYGQQYAASSEARRVYGVLKCGKSTPWTGSSSFVSKFTHRLCTLEDSQGRWQRSKSSREAKREPHVYVSTDHGPQTPDGNEAHDAPSPIQPVPHPSSKSSPWWFLSRSVSRRSPHNGFKVETLKPTPMGSTASDSGQNPAMACDCRSSPLSHGFSPKPSSENCISKSAMSSPSMVKPDPTSHVSLGSKSTSWSWPSPLYLVPRSMERKGDTLSRDSIDAQEFLDLSKSVDVQGQRGTILFIDGVQDSASPPSHEESAPSLLTNPSMQDPVIDQIKTDWSSIMSVAQQADWTRVMLVQPSKAALFKRPKILRGGPGTRKIDSEAPLQMTGRGQASVAS